MAVRRRGAADYVVGVTARAQTLEKAKEAGAIDEGTLDPCVGVAEADLIIISVPGRLQEEITRTVLPACRDGALLTDVASTKAVHVEATEKAVAELNPKVRFVGSHPLAGSEQRGIEAAPLLRLDNAWCVLTPRSSGEQEACRELEEFWRALGMRTKRLSPEEHDEILARSSHLPHLLSTVLIALQDNRSLELSGSGLQDTTRLAGGDPDLWTDICMKNWSALSRALTKCGEELTELAATTAAFSRPGTPEAEAARERLFRSLADSKDLYLKYRALREKRKD